MKSLWDFPSRAAAIEALGVEGFVAAAVREQWSRLGKHACVVPLDKTGKHSFPSKRPDWTASLDREPDVAFA